MRVGKYDKIIQIHPMCILMNQWFFRELGSKGRIIFSIFPSQEITNPVVGVVLVPNPKDPFFNASSRILPPLMSCLSKITNAKQHILREEVMKYIVWLLSLTLTL
mmetsp:Transcript_23375/g.64842  ORF Transcript_23375/g.64842 Transcript_23375/m.64842 type:complete len:105 (-) Transcript_23375:150-464(-)